MNELPSSFNDIILWLGKPRFKPYLMSHLLSYKGGFKILMTGIILTLFGASLDRVLFNWPGFLTFIFLLVCAGIIQVIIKIISFTNIQYWITEDALYLQTGFIRPFVKIIPKEKIIFIDLEINSFEKKLSTGTVVVDCGETKVVDSFEKKVYYRLESVPHPEDVLRLL